MLKVVNNGAASQVVLGFDYGLKQIGVAVGQSLTKTARPLQVLKAKDGIPQWQDIANLLDEWAPQYLVVGLPLNMDGSESDMSVRARKFANRLHGRFGLSVELCDERLSSFAAKSELAEADSDTSQSASDGQAVNQLKRDGTVDAIAARIILETWLCRE